MLTVWIDDTVEQDKRVFEHMKEVGAACHDPENDDILAARAIREVVKAEVFPVRIHFARRIGSSTTQNRRNPGTLFDLIRCHAPALLSPAGPRGGWWGSSPGRRIFGRQRTSTPPSPGRPAGRRRN
ncbi:hypothetical protein [Methanoculleus sp.]|uniref:hypothetical protein n=1 Tax=Methanoculleus sp. TaxID=90427 RepID=UPI002621F68E|nr:hypothetical protein [Methanoculleus sp.]MDI6867762.1 hypothetical protein [Methanoculleus sp.]